MRCQTPMEHADAGTPCDGFSDRDLPGAAIVESTYGVSLHEDRPVREARLTTRVRDILSRGGRVLMPVVALGRAQVRSLGTRRHHDA